MACGCKKSQVGLIEKITLKSFLKELKYMFRNLLGDIREIWGAVLIGILYGLFFGIFLISIINPILIIRLIDLLK